MLRVLLFLLFTSIIYAKSIYIDNNTTQREILSHSFIYIDKTQKYTLEDIKSNTVDFEKNTKERLSYGYSPDFDVWIQFTLKNKTDKRISKILEYGNPLTTHLTLFESKSKQIYTDGLFQLNPQRKTVNPFFHITLEPNQEKTYYLKTSSTITTMIVQLKIWDKTTFYNKEFLHQSILQLFFGAMLVLAIYNLFVYFFSRDISYLFYVLYVLGVIYHQLLYTGISYVYLFSQNSLFSVIQFSPFASVFPILALALFCKVFLKTQQYPRFNKILNIFLIIVPLFIFINILTNQWSEYRNYSSMLLVIFLLILTIYATYKKNRQAYFILIGWLLVGSASLLMYVNSIGVFNIYAHFPYFIEIAFIFEALLFSIALADKINNLQYERDDINAQLIIQQQTEKERLEIEVEIKTKELQAALNEQTTLLRELNHRVKNNMQTIISLVRLQADEVEDENIQDIFTTIQNRISAMSYLHELLYKKSDISYVNTYEYFEILIDNLQDSFENEIEITYNIQVNLKVEEAISCGLILNELVINSFKYAFENNDAQMTIELYNRNNTYYFNIEDNGKGYEQSTQKNSFGLVLVSTLVEDHLKGELTTQTTNGVKNLIIWNQNS